MNLQFAQQVLASQPFSQFLGAQVTRFEAGFTDLELTVKPEYRQQFGFVHGGILSYLADNAMTFAGGSVLGAAVVTAEYKINYLRPATGNHLIAQAVVIYSGKRQAVVRCDVFVEQGGERVMCATAQGTISLVELKEAKD